jgi:hypothetical protein
MISEYNQLRGPMGESALNSVVTGNPIGFPYSKGMRRESKMRVHSVLLFLVACATMRSGGAGTATAQAPRPSAARPTIVYRNAQYGFCFSLPASWEGYTILTDEWTGELPGTKERPHGPTIVIRHPKWTQEAPRQDIPIMIFTLDEWTRVDDGDFSVSAAPIGPSELGKNSKYVFALPPRWIGFYDTLGQDELNAWMSENRLQAPCGKSSTGAQSIAPRNTRFVASSLLRRGRCSGRHFAHQSHRVAIGVAQKSDPKIVIGHLGHQMRFLDELNSLGGQQSVGFLNIGNAKIKDRSPGRRLFRRGSDGEANLAALKKRHAARVKEKMHAENGLVEVAGSRQVARRDRDLTDFVKMNSGLKHIAFDCHDSLLLIS